MRNGPPHELMNVSANPLLTAVLPPPYGYYCFEELFHVYVGVKVGSVEPKSSSFDVVGSLDCQWAL